MSNVAVPGVHCQVSRQMKSSSKLFVQLGWNFTPQRLSSVLLVLSATVHIRQSGTWHGPAVL